MRRAKSSASQPLGMSVGSNPNRRHFSSMAGRDAHDDASARRARRSSARRHAGRLDVAEVRAGGEVVRRPEDPECARRTSRRGRRPPTPRAPPEPSRPGPRRRGAAAVAATAMPARGSRGAAPLAERAGLSRARPGRRSCRRGARSDSSELSAASQVGQRHRRVDVEHRVVGGERLGEGLAAEAVPRPRWCSPQMTTRSSQSPGRRGYASRRHCGPGRGALGEVPAERLTGEAHHVDVVVVGDVEDDAVEPGGEVGLDLADDLAGRALGDHAAVAGPRLVPRLALPSALAPRAAPATVRSRACASSSSGSRRRSRPSSSQ